MNRCGAYIRRLRRVKCTVTCGMFLIQGPEGSRESVAESRSKCFFGWENILHTKIKLAFLVLPQSLAWIPSWKKLQGHKSFAIIWVAWFFVCVLRSHPSKAEGKLLGGHRVLWVRDKKRFQDGRTSGVQQQQQQSINTDTSVQGSRTRCWVQTNRVHWFWLTLFMHECWLHTIAAFSTAFPYMCTLCSAHKHPSAFSFLQLSSPSSFQLAPAVAMVFFLGVILNINLLWAL